MTSIQRFNNRPRSAYAESAGPTLTTKPTKKKKTKPYGQCNIKPLGDRILVDPLEEKEVKKGGIIIPDTAKEKPMESVVVALGTGKTRRQRKEGPV